MCRTNWSAKLENWKTNLEMKSSPLEEWRVGQRSNRIHRMNGCQSQWGGSHLLVISFCLPCAIHFPSCHVQLCWGKKHESSWKRILDSKASFVEFQQLRQTWGKLKGSHHHIVLVRGWFPYVWGGTPGTKLLGSMDHDFGNKLLTQNPPTPLWRWRRAYWGANSYTKCLIINIAVAISALAGGGQKRFRTETSVGWCLRVFSTIFGCLSLRGHWNGILGHFGRLPAREKRTEMKKHCK